MKIAARDTERVLNGGDASLRAFLLHGPDRGLARERARRAASLFAPDLEDPFSTVRLDGAVLKADPARLADELGSLPAFGDFRLVLVDGSSGDVTDAVKNAADHLHETSRLVITASDTTTRHALVQFADKHPAFASIGCYPDEVRDLRQLAQQVFSEHNISTNDEILNLIMLRLGSDRGASRAELERLVLLAGPDGQLTAEMVDEALADSALLAGDNLVQALMLGNLTEMERQLGKARAEDVSPVQLLRQIQGWVRALLLAKSAMAAGANQEEAIRQIRPPLHFKQKPAFVRQLQIWPEPRLFSLLDRLITLEAKLKSDASLPDYTLLGQTLLGIGLRNTPR